MKRFLFNHFFIVLIILFFAIFIRFNRVAELGYFMMDEERDGFLVRRMLVDRRPLLIGGAIPGGINVGPLFFYISAIPYALSNLNPIGPAYAAALVGILTVIAVYFIGRKLFDEKVAILATIFSGFSLLNIIYHRPWWPLTMSQMVTMVAYLALFKLCKGPVRQSAGRALIKWPMILVGALIVGAQSDPSTLSLIPLSVIWLWWKRKQTNLSKKLVFTMVGFFILAHATWITFEFRHDFLNTRAAAGLFKGLAFTSAKARPYEPNQTFRMTSGMLYRLFIPTGLLDVTKQISPAEEFLRPRFQEIWWPGAYILLLVVGYYVIRSFKGKEGRQLLALHFLISLSGILIYTSAFPGYVHEWMWAFMFPAFFLIAGDGFIWLFYKVRPWVTKAGPLLTLSVCVWAIWQLTLFSRLTNIAGLSSKLKIVQEAQSQIAGRPYELRSEGEGGLRYGGWRYLFTLYGDPPVKSYMDYVYEDWLYPKVTVKPEIVVRVINGVDGNLGFEIIN